MLKTTLSRSPRADSGKSVRLRLLGFLLVWFLTAYVQAVAQAGAEQKTARYFESIKAQPLELYAFLRKMPKGGDLHLHLTGSIYAESYIEWAAKAKPDLCVNQTTFALVLCDGSANPPASRALTDGVLYRRMIDAWSMRNSEYAGQSGHDQFFDAFAKFGLAGFDRYGDMVAEVSSRAARERVSYLELMLTPDNGKSRVAASKLDWPADDQIAALSEDDRTKFFAQKRQELLANGVLQPLTGDKNGAVQEGMGLLDQIEKKKRDLLNCDDPNKAKPGCEVIIRYIFQIGRGAPQREAFAQMIAAMETAKADPRLVGLNLVQAEDARAAMNNFNLQMLMLDYLRKVKESEKGYERANITLHAGELAPGLVPPEGLRFHIRDSVKKAHARRIGHGVDIMYEDEPHKLLQEMADRNVLVEICLSSNDKILGVRGKEHPLAMYLKYNVPVALATDDLGISRSEMTREYVRAAEDQGLGYIRLKNMARASIEHAFVGGKSLWVNAKKLARVRECERKGLASNEEKPSPECRNFLDNNEKARLQWELEKAFALFEKSVNGMETGRTGKAVNK
jgi:adenosine deaminase